VLTVALRMISSRSTCVAPVLIATAEAEPESRSLQEPRTTPPGPAERPWGAVAPVFPANSECSSLLGLHLGE
jgi:hypothetical protein